MYGSGVRTGMAVTARPRRRIPRDRVQALAACAVAAAGSSTPATAGPPIAAETRPTAGAATSGFASLFSLT